MLCTSSRQIWHKIHRTKLHKNSLRKQKKKKKVARWSKRGKHNSTQRRSPLKTSHWLGAKWAWSQPSHCSHRCYTQWSTALCRSAAMLQGSSEAIQGTYKLIKGVRCRANNKHFVLLCEKCMLAIDNNLLLYPYFPYINPFVTKSGPLNGPLIFH